MSDQSVLPAQVLGQRNADVLLVILLVLIYSSIQAGAAAPQPARMLLTRPHARIVLPASLLQTFSFDPASVPPAAQPAIHICALLYFIPRLLAAKMQITFLYEPTFEGNGSCWPVIRNRVCAALIIYQLVMALLIGLKTAPVQAGLTVALAPLTFVYMRVMDSKFNTVVSGIVPLSVFTSKQFQEAEAAAPRPLMPYLHKALVPEPAGKEGLASYPEMDAPVCQADLDSGWGKDLALRTPLLRQRHAPPRGGSEPNRL